MSITKFPSFNEVPKNFSGICRIVNGSVDNGVHYFKKGLLHRKDGPSSVYDDGAFSWKINGKPHRLDGPAFIGSGYEASTNQAMVIYSIDGKEFNKEEYYQQPQVIKTLLKNVLKL